MWMRLKAIIICTTMGSHGSKHKEALATPRFEFRAAAEDTKTPVVPKKTADRNHGIAKTP